MTVATALALPCISSSAGPQRQMTAFQRDSDSRLHAGSVTDAQRYAKAANRRTSKDRRLTRTGNNGDAGHPSSVTTRPRSGDSTARDSRAC